MVRDGYSSAISGVTLHLDVNFDLVSRGGGGELRFGHLFPYSAPLCGAMKFNESNQKKNNKKSEKSENS